MIKKNNLLLNSLIFSFTILFIFLAEEKLILAQTLQEIEDNANNSSYSSSNIRMEEARALDKKINSLDDEKNKFITLENNSNITNSENNSNITDNNNITDIENNTEIIDNPTEIKTDDQSVKNDYLEKKSHRVATVRVLNKVTARSSLINIPISEERNIGALTIGAKECWSFYQGSRYDSKIFLEVFEKKINSSSSEKRRIFYGWMTSSSPSLAPFENPIYDIVPIGCNENNK